MSDDAAKKAEERKARKDAKKEAKQKAVSKAQANAAAAENQPPGVGGEKGKKDGEPKAPKQPAQPKGSSSAEPTSASATAAATTATSQPKQQQAPVKETAAKAQTAAPSDSKSQPQPASSATSTTTDTVPVQRLVHMFLSDFSDDWTSGAVPLLAALRRLITVIAQQDDHDCSLAAASMKSKENDRGGELLRHFDEAHLRPFLASKLGLVAPPPLRTGGGSAGAANEASRTNSAVVSRKSLLCVGHLAVVKWVRELILTQRLNSTQSAQTSKPAQGVIDFLATLSESLLDIYSDRIQLAAEGVCRFGSEILASCTTSRPISPAFPISLSQTTSFPSSLIVTLATCSCNRFVGITGFQQSQQQLAACCATSHQPVISHLVSRALAMVAAKCDNQRQLNCELGSEGLPSSAFAPPCLTVAVATPGCCAKNCRLGSLFDEGELGSSPSLVAFPVPLSRLGSAIASGSVAAVLLAADAILANRGSAVLAPRGAGLLALAARDQWHCPVIVLAETYKIIAGGQDEIEETLKGIVPPSSKSSSSNIAVELYMEDADVISADSISVVVTELGAVPAAALPSILRLSQKARPSRARTPLEQD